MSIKVKICATRSLEAAQVAVQEGAEFLGMVFTPNTKIHTVDMNIAKKIGKEMKAKINLVGVFQNMDLSEVQHIIDDCSLDYAQFHGDESPSYLNQITIKKIKAFRFSGKIFLEEAFAIMKQYRVDYYLIDRKKQGEGPMVDLATARSIAKEFPLGVAGGLNPENVAEVVRIVQPQLVDVASGIETNGTQDLMKIKQFIKNAKGALA